MEYRNLGSTGLRVSVAGIGCNNFGMRCDAAQVTVVVHAALDAGINFFDTADVYGGKRSEEILGQARIVPKRKPEKVKTDRPVHR